MNAVDVKEVFESYSDARESMQRNNIYAFMIIPEGFENKSMSGKQPELAIFTNDSYFVAGMFSYKALKMTAALANGAILKGVMQGKGAYEYQMAAKLQPVILNANPLGNPWVSYSVFLNNIILPCLLQLMIMLMTVFAIGSEIKEGNSRRLLVLSNKSVFRLILGKLLPQTILFVMMGLLIQVYLYGYLQFPLANGIWPMIGAMILMVVSSQAIGVFMIGLLPILRLGLSAAALMGVIGFSLVGFSFPVQTMYAPFQILANLFPARHYFMIYREQALNSFSIWYSLGNYLWMLGFVLLPFFLLPRLKKALFIQHYKA